MRSQTVGITAGTFINVAVRLRLAFSHATRAATIANPSWRGASPTTRRPRRRLSRPRRASRPRLTRMRPSTAERRRKSSRQGIISHEVRPGGTRQGALEARYASLGWQKGATRKDKSLRPFFWMYCNVVMPLLAWRKGRGQGCTSRVVICRSCDRGGARAPAGPRDPPASGRRKEGNKGKVPARLGCKRRSRVCTNYQLTQKDATRV